MTLANKTKIVCTIGPACAAPTVMEKMLLAGMNVARLNFSHGTFEEHARVIADLRSAAQRTGKRLAIMADLSGPKIRIGELSSEPVQLVAGASFELTSEEIVGDVTRASVSFEPLTRAVRPGQQLFLNDGTIQLEVVRADPPRISCRVVVGGELRSRKGLNLPGIDLGVSAFTPYDRRCLELALEHGVDAVSQSFVQTAADIHAVRDAARSLGREPFIIAKIERAGALEHIPAILQAADGLMIARGDLGVELPIERIPPVQKQLMREANRAGKPVITATQMLESMIGNTRPTRAEATDVANAILDGTDCVMLSGESAAGKYPVEATAMLAKLAMAIEPYVVARAATGAPHDAEPPMDDVTDLLASSVASAVQRFAVAAVMVPTESGHGARSITRHRLPVWVAAFSPSPATCQQLQFSYGVVGVHAPDRIDDPRAFAREWVSRQGLSGERVVFMAGPSERHPGANHRIEIVDLRQ
jgi:pyruvate kinase